ncbi:MAG: acyl-CoA dehydrogenase family protein [Acidimicrobiia bacterium]
MVRVDVVCTDEERVGSRVDELLAGHPPASAEPESFLAAQFDLGLAWVQFPEGHGGLGVDPALQDLVDRRLDEAGSPSNTLRNFMGVGMAGPTIVAFGTEEQRARWLRPLFTCEDIWCQLFSEPGAGSDVASLATRAVRDGDEWVVNGQKVWTTLAHVARWGLLLARSDPDVPKHRGLTYFVVDMHAPGVDVRPLRQMTGEAEFNEVYFTDVRIPDAYRIGAAGDGWKVATATLMNERVALGGLAREARGAGVIRHAVRLWQARPSHDPVLRDQLAQLWIEAEVLRLTMLRAPARREQGTPGPEGSIGKLAMGELQQRLFSFCMTLLGPQAMLISDYEMTRPTVMGESALGGDEAVDIQKAFLTTRGTTIGGGTTEIGRNVLGERLLGLPREPAVDRDLPWSQVPRN